MNDTKKIRGRGRPRRFNESDAIEAAETLFHERGYDGVGVAELGAAMGIAPPSLYAAFGSKLGLFERALLAYEAQNGGILAEFLNREGPVAEVLPFFLEEAARFYSRPGAPCGCMVLSGTWNSADAEAVALTARLKQAGRDRIRDRIALERPQDAERLADFTVSLMAGLSALARDGVAQERLVAAARAAAPVYA
ncbi:MULTISPECIES: TetR/AcrR family transcriptional regulator [Thalassobaculum]|uniref:Transcriptional regulator, TetR family n=1 Tax=Thalassobaculum litoreum DSM 18839 TaxID=1123362 RepID=A0A8G2EVU2_9PROT|nr:MULTISPECIES: TetR/AcrR family transcriptional regulator [Thalassobaculum]SDG01108.1 transcriptional regulator, TetR family [Thalassobaculum litoreum DSM 18839]